MKKTLIAIFSCVILVMYLSGCDNSNNMQNSENSNIEMLRIEVETESGEKYTERRIASAPSVEGMKINSIGDNFFIEATNDIYYNIQEYIGKGISLQGFVKKYIATNGDVCYAVIRNTPGCCGADGLAGLDIRCATEYPQDGLWVEATGIIQIDPYDDDDYPTIYVSNIKETEITVPFVSN